MHDLKLPPAGRVSSGLYRPTLVRQTSRSARCCWDLNIAVLSITWSVSLPQREGVAKMDFIEVNLMYLSGSVKCVREDVINKLQ